MKITFVPTFENDNLSRSYQITTENLEEIIGTVEGFTNEFGILVSVVKIFNPKYYNLGIGFMAFKKVFDELNTIIPIKVIVGSWEKGGEFRDFNNGMSTNLEIFLKCYSDTKNPTLCAFETPTGKWARKLGFDTCNVKLISNESVNVEFIKS